jgi:hypothetical protein
MRASVTATICPDTMSAGAREEPMATPATRAAAASLLSQVKPVVKVTTDRHTGAIYAYRCTCICRLDHWFISR